MSSFAFSFGLEGSDDCVSELVSNSESADNGAINLKEEPTVKPCFEVLMSPLPETSTLTNFTVHHIGDLAFKQVIPTKHDIIGALTTPANSNLEESDIISGQYEGGFKIWECSYDLADVILEINMTHTSKHRRILELGCGHGVPGIVAMMTFDDIEEIVFSDFNDDVLELTTWPNIILNSPTEKLKNIRCIAGDWSSISPLLGKFDLILSAETLYTVESCKKVFDLVDRHLEQDGVALIASKKYYFGVGGGTFELENLAAKATSTLHCSLVRSYEDRKSNIREVVKLTKMRS